MVNNSEEYIISGEHYSLSILHVANKQNTHTHTYVIDFVGIMWLYNWVSGTKYGCGFVMATSTPIFASKS